MNELKEIKKAVKPTEILLVVDAMTGQEAAGKLRTKIQRVNEQGKDTQECDLIFTFNPGYLFDELHGDPCSEFCLRRILLGPSTDIRINKLPFWRPAYP